MGGEGEDLALEGLDHEEGRGKGDALNRLLNDMVPVLVLDTLEDVALKLLGGGKGREEGMSRGRRP